MKKFAFLFIAMATALALVPAAVSNAQHLCPNAAATNSYGYGPGYTSIVRNGRPFVSFDYYLSPRRPEADAVADLQELATVNAKRPYFLLVHVREYSDVKRVKDILDKLLVRVGIPGCAELLFYCSACN